MALKKNSLGPHKRKTISPPPPPPPYCIGNPNFDPSVAFTDEVKREEVFNVLNEGNKFETAIRVLFGLPLEDEYVYHAVASVTLGQVQRAVELGRGKKLCAWYEGLGEGLGEGEEEELEAVLPSSSDITAYTNIFLPSASPSSALKSFVANAKKKSIRAAVAEHLVSKRYTHPDYVDKFKMSKSKKSKKNSRAPPVNPYFDFWVWSCQAVGWCGPVPEQKLRGHHLLPVLMHHFGCAIPSHEALSVIKILAGGRRTVLDIGSGNGYWSWVLRNHDDDNNGRYGVKTVAIDNGQSEWRVNYLPSETVCLAGTEYLASLANHKDTIMMLVYPVVGGAVSGNVEGSFTRDLMAAYKGDTVVVVGTQNHNGYTGFKNMTFDEYMEREQKQNGWVRIVQIPLPSFAGKDEAMYVYQRGEDLVSTSL